MIVLPRGNTLPPEKKPWLKSRLQTLLQSFEVVPESVDSAVYPECDASSMAIQNPSQVYKACLTPSSWVCHEWGADFLSIPGYVCARSTFVLSQHFDVVKRKIQRETHAFTA
ncbi:hypothetical protein M8J77_009667 [Diaphorina citri]|nr:hypothetical protein M8J77_009667 [Diaphorina citri]